MLKTSQGLRRACGDLRDTPDDRFGRGSAITAHDCVGDIPIAANHISQRPER
jgi:hypothetical protein